jgi:hypothetical protein
MEYTTLGDTGMQVSQVCLGCMSFGDPGWRDWVRGEEFGREFVEREVGLLARPPQSVAFTRAKLSCSPSEALPRTA